MVICVDESGSMAGLNEMWAKGLTLALIQLAHEEQRTVTVIRFSGYIDKPLRIEPGDKTGAIAYVASNLLDGGTNFEQPLMAAIAQVQEQPQADIVFITDRLAPIYPETRKQVSETIEEMKTSLFYLQLDGELHEELQAIAERAWIVDTTQEFEKVEDIFLLS